MRRRTRRPYRRIRWCRHRRPGRPDRRQKTRRASCPYCCPAGRLPTGRPPRSPPPHPRPPRSGTHARHYPARADRSDATRTLLCPGAPSAAARFSLEVRATRSNFRRRRPDRVSPPVPARPERSRADPAPIRGNERGATARRRSRVVARQLIPEISSIVAILPLHQRQSPARHPPAIMCIRRPADEAHKTTSVTLRGFSAVLREPFPTANRSKKANSFRACAPT